MSVRFKLVVMFDSVVSSRLPRLCQKYRTRRASVVTNREP